MKYFTPSLWLATQSEHPDEHIQKWKDAEEAYRGELLRLRDRISANTYMFLSEAEIHDGEMLELRVIDGSRPAPISGRVEPWKTRFDFPVALSMKVLDAYDRFVWECRYRHVRRISVDYPGADSLFYRLGQGFGDFGYHELSDAGGDFLRHEILFASGATLIFEFKELDVTIEDRACSDSG